jgi:hypothetical protein
MIPQHSLPGGRYPLPGPDFHRLDRASFAWRTRTDSELEAVCRRQALISWVTRRTRRRERIEMKAISMKATRCPRSKMVCVLQTYMGKEFNVNEQTV